MAKGTVPPPQIDWTEYDKGRRAEGRLYIGRMREVADKAREIMGKPPAKQAGMSRPLLALVKSEKLSYRVLVKQDVQFTLFSF